MERPCATGGARRCSSTPASWARWPTARTERSSSKRSRGSAAPTTPGGATLAEIRQHDHILTPGRYVGFPEPEEDDEPFAEKFGRLQAELEEQFAEGRKLEEEIRRNLEGLGHGG